mmetsp:Transcript_18444/g.45715  ORF Transcript_18444/g.45715 Transcript_18444/m.45715 type:complete len:232 (+) Transcript_18444:55-750(+)
MKVDGYYCAVLVLVTTLLSQSLAFNLNSGRIFRHTRRAITMASSTEQKDLSAESSPLLISLRDKLRADSNIIREGQKACLVLASQSPRRREILDMMGLAGLYSCEPPPLDESSLQKELVQQNLHPTVYTKKLAEAKAHSLAAKHATKEQNIDIPVFYLGSDTVVDIEDKILEKPKDEEDAKQMLRKLSGQEVSSSSYSSCTLQGNRRYRLIPPHEAPSPHWCCTLSAFSQL